MGHAIFTRCVCIHHVSWKGERKKPGVRNEEKTFSVQLAAKRPQLQQCERGEEERLSSYLSRFLLCPATRRWQFIDFSFRRPRDVTDHVTWRAFILVFAVSVRHDGGSLMTIHERYHYRCSDRAETATKSNLIQSIRAHMFYRTEAWKFAEFAGNEFKWIIVSAIRGDW